MKDFSLVDRIRVESPCPASWEGMDGDGRRRFCSACGLHVHNLSAMSREEAERMLARSGEGLCVRFVADQEGAPVSRDEPGRLLAAWVRFMTKRVAEIGWKIITIAGLISVGSMSGCSQRVMGRYCIEPDEPRGEKRVMTMGRVAFVPHANPGDREPDQAEDEATEASGSAEEK